MHGREYQAGYQRQKPLTLSFKGSVLTVATGQSIATVGKDVEETVGMRVGRVVGNSVFDRQAVSKPIRDHINNGKRIFIISPFV